MQQSRSKLLTDDEISWCALNRHHDAARDLSDAVGPDGSKVEDVDPPDLVALVDAVRAIRPRPPIRLHEAFAFLNVTDGQEDLGFVHAHHGLEVLVAYDRNSLRYLRSRVGEEADEDDVVVLRRYVLDRSLTDDEISDLPPRASDTAEDLFLVLGIEPGGDEAIVGVLDQDRRAVPLAFSDPRRLRDFLPAVLGIRGKQDVEVKRFVGTYAMDPATLVPRVQ